MPYPAALPASTGKNNLCASASAGSVALRS